MAGQTTHSSEMPLRRGVPAGIARAAARAPRGDVVVGGFAALLASAIAARVLQIWRADLEVPFSYRGETQYYLMLIKGIFDHGGVNENPSLGAPFGQELYDLAPAGDSFHLALVRFLGLFSSDPAVVLNVFFLLTFPLIAASAFLVLRLLRVSPAVSVICAVLYALLPYHFSRGEGHLFLSAYYAVPLGAYLVLAAASGEPLFERRRRSGPRILAFVSKRSVLTVAFAVVVASTGVYYAAFTLILLVGATLIGLAAGLRWNVLVHGGVVTAIIAATLAFHLAPTLAYQHEHGSNPAIERGERDTEVLGLKVADLLFPAELHRIDRLSNFTARYRDRSPVPSEGGQALGPVAAVGFLWLLAVALLRAAGVGLRHVPPLASRAAALTVLAVLLGVIGGLATVFAYLVTPELRAWNRISIFIAFFALLGVGLLLDALRRRLGEARPKQALFAAVLIAVLAFGVYNQTTFANIPQYELGTLYRQDRQFFRQVEAQLGPGASVFQLPYIAFPEAGQVVDLIDYDLARGYVHADRLRWSYGAMRTRPEDWSDNLSLRPLPLILAGVSAAGFDGILVDRYGYADRAESLERELSRDLSVEPLVNGSGRHSYFDLRPYAQRLRQSHSSGEIDGLKAAVLEPLRIGPGEGLSSIERGGERLFAWGLEPRAGIVIVNPSKTPRRATLDVLLDRLGEPPARIAVTYPALSGRVKASQVSTPNRMRLSLELQPGENVVDFAAEGPPVTAARDWPKHWFRLDGLLITDERLAPFG
jgi:hypothetical protein